jgi:hypothetical protein
VLVAERFYHCAFHSTMHGQEIVNTFSIFGDDSFADFTPLTAQGLADKIGGTAALVTAYKALFDATAIVEVLTVREMLAPGDTSVPDAGAHDLNVAGTSPAGGVGLPDALCAVLSFHTDAAVRSGHGRMFLPIFASDSISNEEVSNGYRGQVNTLIGELGHFKKGGSAWDAGGHFGLGVYSRTRRARGDAAFAFSITSMTLKAPLTWLESRRLEKA